LNKKIGFVDNEKIKEIRKAQNKYLQQIKEQRSYRNLKLYEKKMKRELNKVLKIKKQAELTNDELEEKRKKQEAKKGKKAIERKKMIEKLKKLGYTGNQLRRAVKVKLAARYLKERGVIRRPTSVPRTSSNKTWYFVEVKERKKHRKSKAHR